MRSTARPALVLALAGAGCIAFPTLEDLEGYSFTSITTAEPGEDNTGSGGEMPTGGPGGETLTGEPEEACEPPPGCGFEDCGTGEDENCDGEPACTGTLQVERSFPADSVLRSVGLDAGGDIWLLAEGALQLDGCPEVSGDFVARVARDDLVCERAIALPVGFEAFDLAVLEGCRIVVAGMVDGVPAVVAIESDTLSPTPKQLGASPGYVHAIATDGAEVFLTGTCGANDLWLARVDAQLDLVGEPVCLSTGGSVNPRSLAANGDDIAIAGAVRGEVTLGPATLGAPGKTDEDAFFAVLRRETFPAVDMAWSMGGGGSDVASGVVVAGGQVFVTGTIHGTGIVPFECASEPCTDTPCVGGQCGVSPADDLFIAYEYLGAVGTFRYGSDKDQLGLDIAVDATGMPVLAGFSTVPLLLADEALAADRVFLARFELDYYASQVLWDRSLAGLEPALSDPALAIDVRGGVIAAQVTADNFYLRTFKP